MVWIQPTPQTLRTSLREHWDMRSIEEGPNQNKECRQLEGKRAEGWFGLSGWPRFPSGWLHSRVERSRGRRFRGSQPTRVALRIVFGGPSLDSLVAASPAQGLARRAGPCSGFSGARTVPSIPTDLPGAKDRPISTGAHSSPAHERSRVLPGRKWMTTTGSWRALGIQPRLARPERSHVPHGPLTPRAPRR